MVRCLLVVAPVVLMMAGGHSAGASIGAQRIDRPLEIVGFPVQELPDPQGSL